MRLAIISFIIMTALSCRERSGSTLMSTAMAESSSLGVINTRLVPAVVKKVAVTTTKKTSFSKGFKVIATFEAQCARMQPASAAAMVFIDKLGPQLSATTDHRIITAYTTYAGGTSQYYCRPGEPAVQWTAEFPEFSSSTTRNALVEVNGVEGAE